MDAAIDLTGGNAPDRDTPAFGTPENPEFREGINVWIWDDSGEICFPRLGIESLGKTWDSARTVMFNCARPDGRVLTLWQNFPPAVLASADARIIDAGPMRFECLEPFARWRIAFDGLVEETSLRRQIAGEGPPAITPLRRGEGTVPFACNLELACVCPPWFQGTLGGTGFVPGEDRSEQLFRVTGTVRIDGEERPYSGGGLKIHRKGGNRTPPGDFFGHVWHSAVFPSGRAFGFIHYYPRPDGSRKFEEGWVLEDGKVVAAEILDRPWLQGPEVEGNTLSFTIRTPRGESRVEARTHASCVAVQTESFPLLQQGIARYRWDGEEAFGMVERSTWVYGTRS